jgi:membrane protein
MIIKPLAQIIVRTGRRFVADRCSAEARGLSFTLLLSIVPFSIVVAFLIKHFRFYNQLERLILDSVSRFLLPDDAVSVVSYIDTILKNSRSIGVLGIVFSVALSFLLLLTLSSIVNRIWKTRRQSSILRAFLKFLAILVGVVSFLFAIVLLQNVVRARAMFGGPGLAAPPALTSIISLILHWALMAILFGLIPHARVRFLYAGAAGILSGTLWFFLRLGLNLYVRYIPHIHLLYGSLAFLPIVLIWIYISWLIVLFGVELNYTFHHDRP